MCIRDSNSGLLSPAGDAATLARHCCRLLDDSALCDSMGAVGRHKVERDFSFAAMVTAHEKIFSHLGMLI